MPEEKNSVAKNVVRNLKSLIGGFRVYWKNLYTSVTFLVAFLGAMGAMFGLVYVCVSFGVLGTYFFMGLLFVALAIGTIWIYKEK